MCAGTLSCKSMRGLISSLPEQRCDASLLRVWCGRCNCVCVRVDMRAGREDEAIDVKRDVREELAEQRKQLKDILDAGGWAGWAFWAACSLWQLFNFVQSARH